jgi:hypothetical protein
MEKQLHQLLVRALGMVVMLGCEGPIESSTGGMILHVSIAPGGSSTFDSLRVHLQGPHTETMTLAPVTTLTFDRLTPGTYTVTVEGFAAGAVDHFGDNRVAVFGGRTTTSALTMSLFQTTLDLLPDSVVGRQFPVSYAALPGATGYRVEWTTDSSFGSGIGIVSDTLTSTEITVPDYGRYYVRVRPVDPFQGQGTASASGSTRLYHIVFAALSAGYGQTCGITTAGALYCWGHNFYGALGVGDTIPRIRPEPVIGGLTFSQVSASEALTCGTTPAGAGYCWGWNGAGQIGVGDTIGRTSPALVAGGLVFTAVSAGGVQTCGIASGGAAYCWGSNVLGGVGDGTRTNRWTPVAVSGGLTFASLSAGYFHNCGLTTGGIAYCWGADTIHLTPVLVPGGIPFAMVSAGVSHNCGVTTGAPFTAGEPTSSASLVTGPPTGTLPRCGLPIRALRSPR